MEIGNRLDVEIYRRLASLCETDTNIIITTFTGNGFIFVGKATRHFDSGSVRNSIGTTTDSLCWRVSVINWSKL